MEFQQEFVDFVNSGLILHNSPTLDRFSLIMEFSFMETELVVNEDDGISPWRISNMISSWINFAIRKKVRILNLDFAGCQDDTEGENPESEYYILPSIVLRCRSLVELYLDRCCIKLFGGIQLKSLRILSLARVGLSNQRVNQILSGCPLLEELSLRECSGLDRLKIFGPTRLKKLNVAISCMYTLDIGHSSIEFLNLCGCSLEKVICPTITHLDIDRIEECVRFSELPSVNEATVFLDRYHHLFSRDITLYPGLRLLLPKLSNATCFKPCAFSIGIFSVWEWTNHPCLCFNWKHVTAVLGFWNWIIPGIYRLLRHSPCLESLVIYSFPFDAAPNDMSKRTKADYFDAGETFYRLKHHLRNITIQGEMTKPYIVDLIKFLLGNARVLEKMMMSVKRPPEMYRNKYLYECSVMNNPLPQVSLIELSELVSGFGRASAQAEVLYQC